MQRPITKFSLITALALSLVACSQIETVVKEEKTTEKYISMPIAESAFIKKYEYNKNKYLFIYDEEKRPYIKDVDNRLPSALLDYIYEESKKNNLSYELMMALAKVESDFNTQLVSTTSDYGLFQLHAPTAKAIADEMGIKTYNLKDSKTNVRFSIHYLKQLRDYWRDQGVDEEDMFALTVISYNRGISGTKSYLKHRNIDDNTYLKRVREWKQKYEESVVES
ncbi:hypothetical protein BC351_00930 [Paenibacillus ferrarius]|uniref:Transglycosylase SLT domain-containing protein n=1 Tax=Paenibacillus ferrarius TaxID=1469647 RepID=A0A1V4HSI8_9BACL|nr:transglycosylase SLT domain-containing protein [Paenibacillus ferrarius]OPH61836.1 hypothetical protein BC351_00930 [Paenibacillus ferrarius]